MHLFEKIYFFNRPYGIKAFWLNPLGLVGTEFGPLPFGVYQRARIKGQKPNKSPQQRPIQTAI